MSLDNIAEYDRYIGTSVSMHTSTWDAIKRIADEQNRTVSNMMETVILEYVRTSQKRLDIGIINKEV